MGEDLQHVSALQEAVHRGLFRHGAISDGRARTVDWSVAVSTPGNFTMQRHQLTVYQANPEPFIFEPLDYSGIRWTGSVYRVSTYGDLIWRMTEHEDGACMVCGGRDNEHQLVLCDGDGCDEMCHTYCMDLNIVHMGDWCFTPGVPPSVVETSY